MRAGTRNSQPLTHAIITVLSRASRVVTDEPEQEMIGHNYRPAIESLKQITSANQIVVCDFKGLMMPENSFSGLALLLYGVKTQKRHPACKNSPALVSANFFPTVQVDFWETGMTCGDDRNLTN